VKKQLLSVGMALAGGACFALALPGLNWWPLVFLFPGLMLESIRKKGVKAAFGIGLAAGILHWMISAHWVFPLLAGYGAFPPAGALASLLGMSLFLSSTWVLAMGMTAFFRENLRPLFFPAVWILSEGLRAFPPFQFPWNTTVSCLAFRPGMLHSLSTWTSAGLGWALVALGSGMWSLFRRESRRNGLLLLSVVVALWVVLSLPASGRFGKALKISVIQPGTLIEERWEPSNWVELTRRVQQLSKKAATAQPDVLVWPESATPWSFSSDASCRQRVLRLADYLDTTIVLNAISRGSNGALFNSACSVRPDGRFSRYDKIHLVPFGEYVPGWARLIFPGKLVHEVGSFEAGKEVRLLDVGVPAGTAICFEMVFPRLTAAECRKGAEVLLTLTNDGWYGRSWALDQHFAQAVLRAVECRRWVVRAALTGISGIISPEGRVVARLDAGRHGVLNQPIFPSSDLSIAVRYPDWWNWVCVLMILSGCCFGRRSRGPGAD